MKSLQAIVFASLMFGSLAANAGQPTINISIGGQLGQGLFGQFGISNSLPLSIFYDQPRIGVRHVNRITQPIYRTHYDKKRKHAKRKYIRHARHDRHANRHDRHARNDRQQSKWRGDERRNNRKDSD